MGIVYSYLQLRRHYKYHFKKKHFLIKSVSVISNTMHHTTLSIICVILCVELSIALPQKWNSFSDSNQFDWASKGSEGSNFQIINYQGSGKGYEGDEDTE